MRREHWVTPGYDCRTECKHQVKGEHGICGDQWVYAVTDGKRAVSISVITPRFPESVDLALHPPDVRAVLERYFATALTLHEADPDGMPCKLVDGGLCSVGWATYFGAQRFWKAWGDERQPEQSEAFWRALESELET